MNEAGHEAQADGEADSSPTSHVTREATPAPGTPGPGRSPTGAAAQGGEVRRQLDRAPGERYRRPSPATLGPSRARRPGVAAAVALGTAVATFTLITFDIGPGLLVLGLAGGWVTGLAIAAGAPAGRGEAPGRNRAAAAAALAAVAIVLGLLLDSLRAYALGGVLLPWEYALARFGVVAPLAIVLAGVAGALRGR